MVVFILLTINDIGISLQRTVLLGHDLGESRSCSIKWMPVKTRKINKINACIKKNVS